jgi:hypothetical protein
MYCFKCSGEDVHKFASHMKEAKGVKVFPAFWYKTSQNINGTSKMVPAVEHLVIGLSDKASANISELQSNNPLDRHNILFGPALKSLYCVKGSNKALNSAQSPMYLMASVASSFVRPETDLIALDLCAGSGSAAFGLMAAGFNVVAVEKDEAMYKGLCERVVDISTKCQQMAAERKDDTALAVRTSLTQLVAKEGHGEWGINSYLKEAKKREEKKAAEDEEKAALEKLEAKDVVPVPAGAVAGKGAVKKVAVPKSAKVDKPPKCAVCAKECKESLKCLLCKLSIHSAAACSQAGGDTDGQGKVCKGRKCEK